MTSVSEAVALQTLDKNKERLVRALEHLESYLKQRQFGYVALNRLTLADLVLASIIYAAAGLTLGHTERKQYAHVFAHYDKVTKGEKIEQYWGTDIFVDEAIIEPRQYPL